MISSRDFGDSGDINIIQMTGSGGGVLLRLGPLGPQDGHLDECDITTSGGNP